ncbi:RcnB family protein [Acetobacter sacchari]|uniref:RcnB family protein n=2 Tax=Acetobacter sacchari TaxID=2661687 RepID=A0ABS3LXP2_9PROT|nr:RcnB family protein [Acetobacter sacchari]MBO1360663.1 RcnB family protein [Acetobacter sacchari]
MVALCVTLPVQGQAQPAPGGWHGSGRGPGPGPNHLRHGGGPGRFRAPPPAPMRPPMWRSGMRYYGGSPWVNDWRGYPGLYAPPYGYRWVHDGNSFLLTAVATGVISAVVAGALAHP